MKRRQIVSGIGSVFTDALAERLRLRALRDAADKLAERRRQSSGPLQPLSDPTQQVRNGE